MAARTTHKATASDNYTGYRTFRIGGFDFRRDEYFTHIAWPGGTHLMPVDAFLRALVRVVAWNFFYGTLNFDDVFGTTNLYGGVELYVGRFNDAYRANGRDYRETIDSDDLMRLFKAMLDDWTNAGYDPFAAPQETGQPFGRKDGRNADALGRERVTAKRMVGLPGAGGAPEIATFAGEVFVIARQSPRAFVERVDFVTSAGHLTGGDWRRRAGLPGLGPTRVITDLGVLAPAPESRELVLTRVHPGVTADDARAATGWPLKVAEPLAVSPAKPNARRPVSCW